jgi:hypothetical protein
MSKRSHTQLHSPTDADDQPLHKSRPSAFKSPTLTDDMGEFEDAWEDEIEEEILAQNLTTDPHGPSAPHLNDRERLIVIS